MAAKSSQASDHTVSWHRDAAKFHALSACILVALLVCVGLSSANGGVSRITELYAGQCSRAKSINQCIQLICAITAMGMSVSFDFFIRLVSSPTVDDLRNAHSRGRFLDIGVHSFRNVRQLSRWRMLCWVLLVTTGIPIQLFFHSSTFVVYTSTTYSIFMTREASTAGADVVYPGDALTDLTTFTGDASLEVQSHFDDILPGLRAASPNWTSVRVQNCQRTYSQDPAGLQRHRDLLLVVKGRLDADAEGWKGAQVWNSTPPTYTKDTVPENQPEVVTVSWKFASQCTLTRSGSSFNVIDTSCQTSNMSSYPGVGYTPDGTSRNPTQVREWEMSWYPQCEDCSGPSFEEGDVFDERSLTVEYCLSEPYSAPCKVFVSGPFLLVSMICVLLGFILSVLVSSSSWRQETCQCLGDGLKIFMTYGPDIASFGTEPMVWEDTEKRWRQVVSFRMWFWTYMIFGSLLVTALWGFGMFGARSLIYDGGFGESLGNRITTMSRASGPESIKTGTSTFLAYRLTANLPQILLSIYYFTFSSLYSTLFQGKYWADFAVKAQQLRVSSKHGGHQVSTHTFQFPLRWGISFISLKALLGWLLTQTIYVMPIGRVSFWQIDLEFEDVDVYIGYSVRAMIPGLVVALVTAVLPVILGCRRLPMKSVIVGTDSVAIASYCQRNATSERQDDGFECQQDPGIRLDNLMRSRRDVGRLKWGVLDLGSERDQRPGVLGLGSEEEVINVSPIAGHRYIAVALAAGGGNSRDRNQANGWGG